MMPDPLPRRIRAARMHPQDCICPACNRPAPSDLHPLLAPEMTWRLPILFVAGMATAAAIVAASGNLGAALRALVGL